METEHKFFVLAVDENLQSEIDKLVKDGWVPVQGVKPVAIYHAVRVKQQPSMAAGGAGVLHIDESKIGIIRGGKVIS